CALFTPPSTTAIYTLSLHDALPVATGAGRFQGHGRGWRDQRPGRDRRGRQRRAFAAGDRHKPHAGYARVGAGRNRDKQRRGASPVKPPQFDYHDPHAVDETLALLAEHGDDAKLLAGGQSLVPLLNFRLTYPGHLIDLGRIPSLSYIRREDGVLRIGAMARQATLERSPLVATHWPLLTEALGFVAHAQIRNRGTVGGSVAHADPAAELPVAFTALEA